MFLMVLKNNVFFKGIFCAPSIDHQLAEGFNKVYLQMLENINKKEKRFVTVPRAKTRFLPQNILLGFLFTLIGKLKQPSSRQGQYRGVVLMLITSTTIKKVKSLKQLFADKHFHTVKQFYLVVKKRIFLNIFVPIYN